MNFITESHRYGLEFLEYPNNPNQDWIELKDVLTDISDEDIIKKFMSRGDSRGKSISEAINKVIKERLTAQNWVTEAHIFNTEDPNHPDPSPRSTRFRLDFAKNDLAIEVAFNHGEAISWNLLKPVLSSEMNHVQKEVETKIGIIITATDDMKQKGGFDSAIGSYSKFLRYLLLMNTQLVSPLVIIGLEAPETFYIRHEGVPRLGHVERLT